MGARAPRRAFGGLGAMLAQSTTEENSALGLTPPINPRMPLRVAVVRALPGLKLHVGFNDGLEGIVDMAALIHSQRSGVFAQLADEKLFEQVCVTYGAVTWPGGLDLAPDAMYRQILSTGCWIPE